MSNSTNICVIYARGKNKESIKVQIAAGRQKAKSLGVNVELLEIEDLEADPFIAKRTSSGFSSLREMVKEHKVNSVIVHSYGRLTRDLIEFVEIMAFLTENGVKLIVTNENDDCDYFLKIHALLA